MRPFQRFKLAHVLADWNPNLHSYQDTDDLGYMKVVLEKVHPHAANGQTPYIFELRAGFIIESYDYMKSVGYYAMQPPLYAANEDMYFVSPMNGWTIHPCLQDAFDTLSFNVQVMQRDGWKVVKKEKSTKTRYEFEARKPNMRARL